MILNVNWHSFIWVWRTPFSISHQANLVVNYFSIVLLEMSLSDLHFWRTTSPGILLRVGSLGGCFLFFVFPLHFDYTILLPLRRKVSAGLFSVQPLYALALGFLFCFIFYGFYFFVELLIFLFMYGFSIFFSCLPCSSLNILKRIILNFLPVDS